MGWSVDSAVSRSVPFRPAHLDKCRARAGCASSRCGMKVWISVVAGTESLIGCLVVLGLTAL